MGYDSDYHESSHSDCWSERWAKRRGEDGSDSPKLFEPPATLDAAPHTREQRAASTPATRDQLQEMPPTSELAEELHPRARLIHAGPRALSSAELLAAILGGEPKRAMELAEELITRSGSLTKLRSANYHDLTRGDAASLSEAKACTVLATIELGKRLTEARGFEPVMINRAEDVHKLMAGRMRDLDKENFAAVLLDTKNQVLGTPTISVGTALSAPVHPREVFKPAIRASAAGVILVHNHPSGQPEPSREDREVTDRLARVGQTVGIDVMDHVIIAGERWIPLKERGVL